MTLATDKKIRVLIVDDSSFMRIAIEKMLQEDPKIEIIGSAANGQEALEKIQRLKPDVVTMDIEMPVMDGLHALKEIMRTNPVPVLMVSSLTQNGAKATFDAMDLGAIDYIPKPGSVLSMSVFELKQDLIKKIYAAANCLPQVIKHKFSPLISKRTISPIDQSTNFEKIVLIGSSTGGPPAIRSVLSPLPGNLPAPIVVAQHMPQAFTRAFAQRLDELCGMRVKEASDNEIIQKSVVYICPGDSQTRIKLLPNGKYAFSIVSNRIERKKYAPCIDTLFLSATQYFGANIIGIILTGMGDNGVEGLAKIKELGGFTIAQDKATSVVYGMPRVAMERKAAIRILPVTEIHQEIQIFVK